MSTVLVIVGILVYAGPCLLFWLLGKRAGYEQGYRDGRADERNGTRWNIPNPGDGYQR